MRTEHRQRKKGRKQKALWFQLLQGVSQSPPVDQNPLAANLKCNGEKPSVKGVIPRARDPNPQSRNRPRGTPSWKPPGSPASRRSGATCRVSAFPLQTPPPGPRPGACAVLLSPRRPRGCLSCNYSTDRDLRSQPNSQPQTNGFFLFTGVRIQRHPESPPTAKMEHALTVPSPTSTPGDDCRASRGHGTYGGPPAPPAPPYRRPSLRTTRSSLSAGPAPPTSLPSSQSPWPSPRPSRTSWSLCPRRRRWAPAGGSGRSPPRPPPAS